MKTKTYTIKVVENDNGKLTLHRINDGFSAYELLGLMEEIQLDIIGMTRQTIKPFDEIKRQFVSTQEEGNE